MINKARKISKGDFRSLRRPEQLLKANRLTAKIFKKDGPSRFSFAISKKLDKRAVARNSAKRKGFLALRRYIDNIKPGLAIQFHFTSLPKDIAEIESDLASIIKNIK